MDNLIGISILLLSSILCFSQEEKIQDSVKLAYGLKGGLNVAYIPEFLDEIKENDPKIGFHVGAFLRIPLGKKFALQPEVLYSEQGTKTLFIVETSIYNPETDMFEDVEFDLHGDFHINYINIPVIFRWSFYDNFYIGAGPYIGFMTKRNVHAYTPEGSVFMIDEEGSFDYVRERLALLGYSFNITTEDIDMGIVLDGGYSFDFGLTINGRYQLGASDLLKSTDESIDITAKNSVFMLSLEYDISRLLR